MIALRTLALGVAAGSRSSLGISGPALFRTRAGRSRRHSLGRVRLVLPVASELVVDKLPKTPSRLEPAGLAGRFASGAIGSVILARGAGASAPQTIVAVLAGALGTAAGAYGGAAWRRWASQSRPDWQGAVAEDTVALSLAYAACRGA
jgi:uncharacterized membrane protein